MICEQSNITTAERTGVLQASLREIGPVQIQFAGTSARQAARVDTGKWRYIFGRATGVKNAAHNAPRTTR
jgi:hypothetical protein